MLNLDRQGCHEVLTTAISPLPIAWISTVSDCGSFNAAPYSMVAPISSKPPIVCFSCALYGKAYGARAGQKKDTANNIEFSRDFVINIVDESLIKQAVQTSYGYSADVDEIKAVGLTAIKGEKVKSPRIVESKVSLECRLMYEVQMPDERGFRSVFFGEVVMAHIKDDVWVNGKIDPSRLEIVGRMAKDLYCRTRDLIEVKWTEPG